MLSAFALAMTLHTHNRIVFRDITTGEIYELKAQLNSDRRDKKRDAIKKVIANMTVGKDVRYEQGCTVEAEPMVAFPCIS